MKLPKQTVLPFGKKEVVLNRQIRESAAGKKARRGLGRPKKKKLTKDARVAHVARDVIQAKTALHVTVKVSENVPNLRARRRFNVIRNAFVKFCGSASMVDAAPAGFRLVHFVVLGNHLHFIVEADHKQALSVGMQKLLHSISRRLNALNVQERGGRVSTKGGSYTALPGWLGRVFRDRYHAHELRTPTEMANAVRYVLTNPEHHYGRTTHRSRTAVRLSWDSFTSLGLLGARASANDPPMVGKPLGFLLIRECERIKHSR